MYESFYNLHSRPFQLSPDARFFYNSRGHKRAMSYLRYGIAQGEGFIVIMGDIGTGKTTLVQNMFDHLAEDNLVAAKIVTTQLEADDMLRMVISAFGLSYDGLDKASLIKVLESYFVKQARAGKRVLLVVDEVQNIPLKSLEELRMLSNFQVGGMALLQIFLLGQREFVKTLQAEGLEQLRQRVIASYYLKALEQDEVQGYIDHRLVSSGWKNDPVFKTSAYDEIYEYTAGTPRRINTLCDRLMLYGYLEEIHEIDAAVVKTVTSELQGEITHAPVAHETRRSGENKVSQKMIDVEQRLCVLEGKIEELESGLKSHKSRLSDLWSSK
ncbi:MAG: XrtA-associated ATPase [Gammaproteobacteria bacterium]|nr:XrtA-associated ATPase [Gammaproteobacteria bacterium]